MRLVFGPVPSRRLGTSLGINNIPYKFCTYSCIYCQLGLTRNKIINRRAFYDPEEIAKEVASVISSNVKVDYISFVPDGEPTLDINLGKAITTIKRRITKIPVAILTNASLLWREDVRLDLSYADLVSIKVDSVIDSIWRKINRPHVDLKLDEVLSGIKAFAMEFKGTLISETMLVRKVNVRKENLEEIASYLKEIGVKKAFLLIPTRPPAEKWVLPPHYEDMYKAYVIFKDILGEERVELLSKPERPDFQIVGSPEEYIVKTVEVHPMRYEHAIQALSRRVRNPEQLIMKLIEEGKVKLIRYAGTTFLIRPER